LGKKIMQRVTGARFLVQVERIHAIIVIILDSMLNIIGKSNSVFLISKGE